MSVATGDVVTMVFTTTNPATGAAADADSLPTGVLWVDGVANGATVTIADATGTGKYTFSVTMPTLTISQRVQVVVNATIGGVACVGVVWEDQATPAVNVTLWKDATAPAMTGDAYAVVTNATYGLDKLARTGADGDTMETLSDQLDAIDVNGTAAAVWAYTPRTLTQTAAAVASVMAGTSLTITRGDTLSATLTGLGNITGYANLWFTVKWATSDLDAAAIIQIDTDTGLLTVNGAAATAGNGSITVDDATAGDITIALEASVTDDLTPATGLVYDVQWQSGTSIYTLTSGVAVVSADVTRAVA